MLYFIIYLIVGIVLILSASFVHLKMALDYGYSLDIICEATSDVMVERYNTTIMLILAVLFGWIIWPIRLIIFMMQQDLYFELYRTYTNREEESE